eukprot:1989561-Pyramimonas_sp.AAC.1
MPKLEERIKNMATLRKNSREGATKVLEVKLMAYLEALAVKSFCTWGSVGSCETSNRRALGCAPGVRGYLKECIDGCRCGCADVRSDSRS